VFDNKEIYQQLDEIPGTPLPEVFDNQDIYQQIDGRDSFFFYF
jgi:hypothetical protein